MTRLTRRELFQIASSVVPAYWCRAGILAGTGRSAQTPPGLELHAIGPKLTLLSGPGGNIAILQGENGLLLVDSGLPQTAEAVDQRARPVGPAFITILINTHFHFDHVGANERLGREGARIIAHDRRHRTLGRKREIEWDQRP